MAMPNKMELTLPLLKLVSERQISIQEATSRLAKMFNLSASEQAEMLASGKGRFYDRVGWARVYLRQAGLVDLPRRGHLRITKQGCVGYERRMAIAAGSKLAVAAVLQSAATVSC